MDFYESEQFPRGNFFGELTTCDNIFEEFTSLLREYQSQVNEIGTYADGIDEQIKIAFAEIANELNQRLMALCQQICNTKNRIQTDCLKYKSEIFSLMKENKQLSEQVTRLENKLRKMEETIGKNGCISYMTMSQFNK